MNLVKSSKSRTLNLVKFSRYMVAQVNWPGTGKRATQHLMEKARNTGVHDEGIARLDSVEPMGWSDSPKWPRFERVTTRLVRALRRNRYRGLLLMTGGTSVSRCAETRSLSRLIPPLLVQLMDKRLQVSPVRYIL